MTKTEAKRAKRKLSHRCDRIEYVYQDHQSVGVTAHWLDGGQTTFWASEAVDEHVSRWDHTSYPRFVVESIDDRGGWHLHHEGTSLKDATLALYQQAVWNPYAQCIQLVELVPCSGGFARNIVQLRDRQAHSRD